MPFSSTASRIACGSGIAAPNGHGRAAVSKVSGPGAVAEEDRTVAEAAFVEEFEIRADVAVPERALAAAHEDGNEEQLVLVHQPGLDRLGREIATADGEITVRGRLELPDGSSVEASFDPGPGAGRRLQRGRVHDLVGRLPDLGELLHDG